MQCSETGHKIRLTAEEIWLVEIRQQVKVEALCVKHYETHVSKFAFFEKYCSDPYKVHTKQSKYQLSEISIDMHRHDHDLVPGRKICMHCRARVSKNMKTQLESAGGEGAFQGEGGGDEGAFQGEAGGDEGAFQGEGGDGEASQVEAGGGFQESQHSTTSDHTWSQEFNMESGLTKVNEALGILQLSPLKKIHVGNISRVESKLKSVTERMRGHLNMGPSHSGEGDSEGFIESLSTRYRSAPDRNEKYKILTSVPAHWNAYRISKTFSCSYTIARDAVNLRRVFGPGCYPGLKSGHKIPAEVVLKVVEFYKAQDISRELPGQRDCLSVRVGGVREVRQKRLLLLGLREAYAQFQEDHPTCSIGFSTFASLRPREVVLPGANHTFSKHPAYYLSPQVPVVPVPSVFVHRGLYLSFRLRGGT